MIAVTTRRRPPARRGAILIVVLAMLALFAVVGLSFVLYADAQASTSRNNKISANLDNPPNPLDAVQRFLPVLIYDVGDTDDVANPTMNLANPMRGHSLARLKQGYQFGVPRLSPYVGTGTVNETIPPAKLGGVALNRTQIVNHTYIPAFNAVVDPERQTEPGAPAIPPSIPFRSLAQIGTPPNATAGGNYVNKAAPYTYPDRNNFFLAMMDPATGQIVTPSFHRNDLFTNTNPIYTTLADQIANSLKSDNPRWTSPEGRLMAIRPRPQEHPNFPYPQPNADGTVTGDVSNLKFITGSQKNDSVWIDFGAPVLEWRGRKYKALIAPLILDLNSRINLSVAGNIRMGDTNPANTGPYPPNPPTTPDTNIPNHPKHSSNQGWGPWEQNPTALFPVPPAGQNWELYSLIRQRFPNPNPVPVNITTPPFTPPNDLRLHGAVTQPDNYYGSPDGRFGHTAQPLIPGAPPTYGAQVGLLTPPYSLVDSDGVSTLRPSPIDPMTLPAAIPPMPPFITGFTPFPSFPGRFPNTQSAYIGSNSSLKNHPSMFNPFQWKRGGPTVAGGSNHPFGNDDAIKWMTRYTDSKNRFTNSDLYQGAAALMTANGWGAPTNLQTPFFHATTTTFSSSQQWAEVPIATGAVAGVMQYVNLGPIDVNRALADYRKTAVWLNPGPGAGFPRYEPVPHSPVNMWDPRQSVLPANAPRNTEPAHYAKARLARQTLARDIFIRLIALSGLVDGTNIAYNTSTGYLYNPVVGPLSPIDVRGLITADAATWTPRFAQIRQYAQLAANIVDYIDADDINTAFVWNPVNPLHQVVSEDMAPQPVLDPFTFLPFFDPSDDPANFITNPAAVPPQDAANHTVYGTELPRLVINEAYGSLDNTRNDPGGPGGRATLALKRRYWIELHNPLPADALQPVLSDGGAARLQYEAGLTQMQDPTNPAASVASPLSYNPYRIEVAKVNAGAGVQTPYSNYLAQNPGYSFAQTELLTTMTLQARIDTFAHDANPPSGAPLLVGDQLNVVLPANGSPGAMPANNQLNLGYYLIGPRDQFYSGGVNNSMSLQDPPAGTGVPTPALPVNALTFDATGGAPANDTEITDEKDKTSVVILRRLANPYRPKQDNPLFQSYNPYITVDYVENIPTRDMVVRRSASMSSPPPDNALSTVGRKHPYVSFPTYGNNIPHPSLPGVLLDGVQNQAAMGVTPPHTFFTANSFLDNGAASGRPAGIGMEWLAHMDRQLINSLELLHVSTQSPALLTQKFYSERLDATGVPFTPNRVFEYQRHTPWAPTAANITDPIVPALRTSGWHKALDLLVCGNPMPGVPVGGREPGKINPNTMNNVALLNAILDPQPGNSFTAGGYAANPTLVDPTTTLPLWNGLVGTATSPYARTPNGVPRATFAETGVAGGDRPFRSFAGSTDLQDSLLRQNVAGAPGSPVFFNNSAGAVHPYVQAEPLRKSLNSLTPTSDSFLVAMTVGFFEVTNANPALPFSVTNQPVLGRELFDRVAGDLRAQYAAVVDRSQLAIDHDDVAGATLGTLRGDVASTRLPVQAKLLRDVPAGTNQIVIECGPGGVLYDNGDALGLMTPLPGGRVRLLRLGSADVGTAMMVGGSNVVSGDGEWVQVQAVTQLLAPDATGAVPTGPPIPVPGHYVVTFGGTLAATTRPHSAGTKVGTVVLGNPGPQSGLTLELLRQRGLVPYLTKIDP
jgi:hypothetical protein